jgi:hypothetical protein
MRGFPSWHFDAVLRNCAQHSGQEKPFQVLSDFFNHQSIEALMFKFKSRIFFTVLAPTITALLAACGGGSDGDQAAASVNVAAAWHNYLAGTWNWHTIGTGPDGKKYDFFATSRPGSPGKFSLTGNSGATSIQAASVSMDGVSLVTSTQTLYYNGDNLFGISYDDGTCSTVPPLASPLPGVKPIGSSGDFATSNDYTTCTLPLQSPASTTENHWTIESDSNVTLFCIMATVKDPAGQTIAKEQDCLEAAADGTFGRRAKFTIYLSDTLSIVTRNF